MFGVKVKVEGAAELQALLKSLGTKLEKKVLKSALRKAARPVLTEIRANAPEKTGLLKKSFTVRALKTRRGVVGVKVTTNKRAPHAHLVELGTTMRKHKSGKGTGKVVGKGFMAAAANAKKSDVVAALSSAIKAGVERERAKKSGS